MTIYTVSDTKNKFTIYHDEALINKTLICVLSIGVNFMNSTIPDILNIHCDQIDMSQRLMNGKRSDILIQLINSNEKNQVSFNSNHKQFIEMIPKEYLPHLSFRIADNNGKLVDNIKSVSIDIEII